MTLPAETLTILVLVALGLSVLILFILATHTGRSLRSRSPAELPRALSRVLDQHGRAIERLEAAVRKLAAEDRHLGRRMEGAVQRVGLVRYDAFEDMGGRLSFSCALLDQHGDGVVVTSINGREDNRVYAKPVRMGRSPHNLSAEEEEAIRQALSGPRTTAEVG